LISRISNTNAYIGTDEVRYLSIKWDKYFNIMINSIGGLLISNQNIGKTVIRFNGFKVHVN